MLRCKVVTVILLTAMTGCAATTPVAVKCPPFPTPPDQLMTAPAIADFSKYYDALTTKPRN